MCGLAGYLTLHGTDASVLVRMADALAHRGPDGEGFAVTGAESQVRIVCRDDLLAGGAPNARAGLAHRRLTVIDLSDDSAQPMVDATRRFVLVYNGELYNYVELRRELEAAGRVLRTSGDTEVVLQAWMQWGPGCVERFVGMWAFAILDLERREMVLCRDRFGIKPLFYTRSRGALLFASEIKGLLAAIPTPEPHDATVLGYITAGTDTGLQTFFRGVRRLPPAHMLRVSLDDPGTHRLTRYWAIPEEVQPPDRDAVIHFADLFRDSVRLHTRSDVPVGTCLSGGLDSSSIVCTAWSLGRGGLLGDSYRHLAFGYVPPDKSVSERRWMDMVVDRTGVDLTEVHPTRERFEAALPSIANQQDEPFGSTSIAAQWFVFEAAHEAGIKVMLDGQGADEVLGGYHGYLATVAAGMITDRRRVAYARLAIDHRRRLGTWPLPGGTATALIHPRVRSAAARLRGARTPKSVAAPDVLDVMTDGLRQAQRVVEPLPSEMQALLRHQVQASLPALLRYEDRNSMAHSIEARVPFLDHRLVELAFTLPATSKVRGADTKRLLRSAMKDVLPEAIRTRRDKLGFRADPAAAARFAAANREDLIANRTAAEDAWFEPTAVAAFIDAAQRDASLDFPLWRVVNVKLWVRAHWDGDHA